MDRTKLYIIGGAIGGIIVVALLLFFVLGGFGKFGTVEEPATLQMWGVFDNTSFYEDIIRNYEAQNPNVRVIYREFSFEDYERELINSFAAGTGPDIWLMHNTWLAKHGDKIQPMPQLLDADKKPLFTIKDFQEQFVDVAYSDLVAGGQVYALPFYVDTLALYYNKDLFNAAGITRPPRTYEELNSTVSKLTAFTPDGDIQQSGIALGTARNINRSTDIAMLLMMQSGVQMTNSEGTAATFAESVNQQNVGEIALQYYTDFANPSKQVYTWNAQQDYSIDAFVNGRAAMMVNYSHHIGTIRSKAARFNFGVAPVPQISGSPTAVSFANYWAPTVSKQSKYANQAWKFLIYATSFKGAAPYVNVSNRPSARRDYIEQQKNDPDLGPFATQALSARSWRQVDNSAIETIFADMIEAINFGRATVRDALESAQNQVNVLMRRSF